MSFEAESIKSKTLKSNIDVHISKWVIVSIIVTFLVLILLYSLGNEELRNVLDFAMPVLAGGGTVYGAFYAKAAFLANIERDRVQHTLEMLAAQNTPEFVSLYIHMRNSLKEGETVDWEEVFINDPKLEVSLSLVLASFEDMSDAAYLKQIDERTIYLANAEIMPLCWNQMYDYVLMVRKKRRSNAYLGRYEQLCKSWAAGKYISGGDIALDDLMKSCMLPEPKKKEHRLRNLLQLAKAKSKFKAKAKANK